MAMQIWKDNLVVDCEQVLQLPIGANILSVQSQRNRPTIWYSFNIHNTKLLAPRKIITLTTGCVYEHMYKLRYIGTYQLEDGYFIGHVYEEILSD